MSVELVAAERELEEAARSFPKHDEPRAETLRRLQRAAIAYAVEVSRERRSDSFKELMRMWDARARSGGCETSRRKRLAVDPSCPGCGYPDTFDGQNFKGIYDPARECPHCHCIVVQP